MRWVTTGGHEADRRQARRTGRAPWANASQDAVPGAEPAEVAAASGGQAALWSVLDLTAHRAEVVPATAGSVELIGLEETYRSGTGSGWTRRSLALGGFVATGLLSSSLAQPTTEVPAAGGPDLGASAAAWNANAALVGELAGLAGSADDLINLSQPDQPSDSGEVVRSRPPALLLTTDLLRELAWTSTRDSVLPLLPFASLEATLRTGVGGNGRASTWQYGSRTAHRKTGPLVSVGEQDAIDRLTALAAQADLEQAAQEEARQVETARLASEAEAQRVAAAASQAAAAAQAEAQRVAAEEAARVAAEAAASAAAAAAAPEAETADQGWNNDWEADAAPEESPASEAPAPAPPAAPQPAAPAPAAPAPAELAPAAAPTPANDTESIESAFFAMINQERAAVGLPALSFDAGLRSAARVQAANIAAAGSLYHQDLHPLLAAGWRTAGENVGYGYDIPGLHAAFVASSGHYANMVNGNFSGLGVGVVVSGGRIWVAHVFAG